MDNSEDLKKIVKDKYSEIALQSKEQNEASCCGVGGCSTVDYAVFADSYKGMQGYETDADLGLGCGLPTEFAQINLGDTVVDLGSGAGNDCFVARAICGAEGKVIGVDMTEAMVEKARENADKLHFNNVEFRLGDIEQLPMGAHKADVVISNCVLNLVPNKEKAFKEIFRILKPEGHFSISDVVIKGQLPEKLKNDAEMYAGCVSGAIQLEEYMEIINQAGFKDVSIQKQKTVQIPLEILSLYLTEEEIATYNKGEIGVYSITVYGKKGSSCCAPGCC